MINGTKVRGIFQAIVISITVLLTKITDYKQKLNLNPYRWRNFDIVKKDSNGKYHTGRYDKPVQHAQ